MSCRDCDNGRYLEAKQTKIRISGHRLSDAEVSGKQSALAAVLAMFTAAKAESSLLHLRHA
jgi:hypothetical protein